MGKAKSIEEVVGTDKTAEETDNVISSQNVVINSFQANLTTAKKTYFTNEFGEVVEPGSKEAKKAKSLFLLVREGAAVSAGLVQKYGFEDGVISTKKKAEKADSENK